MKAFKTLLLLPVILLLAACTATKYVSIRPEIEPEFMNLSYEEIVAVMGRQPDAVETDANGGRILVYNAKGDYLKERYEGMARFKQSSMFIRIQLDEEGICFGVQTNIVRKSTRYDKDRAHRNAYKTLENILYIFKPVFSNS